MMSSTQSRLLIALMSALLLSLCGESEAAISFDCCLGYTQHVFPTKFIDSFTEQRANEACDINAVIFHTRRKLAVCADPRKKWVKLAVRAIRQRVRKV